MKTLDNLCYKITNFVSHGKRFLYQIADLFSRMLLILAETDPIYPGRQTSTDSS